MGYKKDAIRGLSWMSGFRFVTRILTFGKTAVLARVLSPSQFGIFGIASLILVLLEILTETGINIILVQSKKKIEEYINSAWVVSIIRGTIIALLLISFSPVISLFFNSPESFNILLLISLVPFIRGFINPSIIKFQKELQFNKEFWFRTTVFFFDACIAIILALVTSDVSSLVWGLIAGASLEVILSFILVKPRPRFVLDSGYFKEIFHKGKWITVYGVFNYIAGNGDNVVVGKILGTSYLGLYQMAYKISILPISEISDVVSRVVFPVYAKIANEKQRILLAFYKTIIYVGLSSSLLGAIIFLFPKQIVLILLGEKWLEIIPVLQILVIYGVLRTVSGPASALFLALEKQSYVSVMTFVRLIGLAITIYPFVHRFGIIGAGYSALISAIVEIPVIVFFIIKVSKSRIY